MSVKPRHLIVSVCIAAVVILTVGVAQAGARTLPRGVCQSGWYMPYSNPVARAELIKDVRTNLRASWVRFEVFWLLGQPRQPTASDPGYDDAYLRDVADTVAQAKAAGLNVLVTVFKVPRWASQSDLWDSPVPGQKAGYQDYFLPEMGALDEFADFMEHLARLCGSDVDAYECWNEPNLWMTLAPQKIAGDARYAARRYVEILKQFRAGVRAGDPDATVVAGAFGPYGTNDKWRTAPQRFAQQIAGLGAARYMDALSHHPYQAGTSHRFPPDKLPRWPDRAVSLRNLNTVMKLFPGKPVYLTEYGYNTKDCPGIGLGVGATRQADYLRKAYAYAARYSRVKVMIWFLQRDAGGWSTGLRTESGTKKPSWYAFSRSTRIALKASATKARKGARVKLSGKLAWTPLGGSAEAVTGKTMVLESKVGSHAWKRVRTLRSKANGAFVTYVRPKQTIRYRVRWLGVAGSASRRITVR